MKTLFEILPSDADNTNDTLILEVGHSLVSALIKDEDTPSFSAIAIYQLENADKNQISGAIQHILEEKDIFKLPIKKVRIVSAFHQSVLVPFSLSEKGLNSEIVDIIHGDLSSSPGVHSDLINEEGIYNVYKMPDLLWDVLTGEFGNFKLNHLYTSLLRTISRESDKMHLVFYPGKIIIVVVKGGKCLLVNTFDYTVPGDVSYLLLNLCRQFELNDIPLELSGLIEENSSLFKEIYKYFSVLTFANLPERCTYPDEMDNYPPHYFSHHFAIGLCE